MTFTIKGKCLHRGELVHRRKTPEAALKIARELAKDCYDVHIITPEGRDYHSTEFGDLPRSPRVSTHRGSAHAR